MSAADLTPPSDWSLAESGTAIERSFVFHDFSHAFGFMVRVALAAEKQDHHPDWSNVWNRVHIRLSTHDAGALTQKDIRMARTINELIEV
jgi:4a-hydroxytetrahydrobiopterin dehydratase